MRNNKSDFNTLIKLQQNFFNTGKTKELKFRRKQLLKLKHVLESEKDKIYQALQKAFQKSWEHMESL